ncbi:MAG: hypothetical protein EPN79_05350 [Burkholderiaceae bacterium]|nr:MAG: hypothetical protein EPN79_05350 [Burkholderiaceae bacterium]TBR75887.1 MAG: hypothetical protein EPN64_10490 [Burkholderiaceae bacterium]
MTSPTNRRPPDIPRPIDGTTSGLNAIGLAIIEAGSSGVRGLAKSENVIAWRVRPDTPDGVYFACLCMRAAQGKSLPPVEQVLEIIRPFLVSNEGRHK